MTNNFKPNKGGYRQPQLSPEEWKAKKQAEKDAVYQLIDETATAIVQDGEKFRGFLDTKARLDLSRILEAIHQVLEEEQSAGFPNLMLDDAVAQEIEMTTLPADYTGEGTKLSTFYCSFILTYEKKGKWD